MWKMAALSLRVDVVSDVVCPWCYIGSKRLKQVLDSDVTAPFGGRIDVFWHPYRLMPAKFTPLKKLEFYNQRFGPGGFQKASQHVQKEGASCGINFTYNDDSMLGPTTDAHRLISWVPHEKQQAVVDSLFAAYHERGLLISDHEILASNAEQCGLDKAAVLSFLKSDAQSTEVEEEIARAPEMFNMAGGVPHFVFTIKGGPSDVKTIVSGGQSLEYFRMVLSRALTKALQQSNQ